MTYDIWGLCGKFPLAIIDATTPDESLWAEVLEAWNTLGRNPELVKEINRYMRDVLRLEYSISRQEIIRLIGGARSWKT